ncbi:low molecular weight protein-tyrosine-phosphatase [Croceitalea sp. MTPC9]|uniref:low molecular weight protein-tyrosine-phosphatase n=1 Tax=unclassified Croceitalea TaxID=2632280 RepID=UPI002B3D11B1|nr:low molecular weight protein-tyrosine-phosphatase [Croceitalea sp. MTPC6]GMN15471.1 low molecular weight protein-tyrosine-phosphatase [Croceitalea sp. MTPC9]
MTKVLMVCLGNICRSPLAEGILQSKVNPDLVFVDSAGTGGFHIGNQPDERSIVVAKKYGLDISQQRCRKFSLSDFDKFDLIYVMDKSNYANVITKAKTDSDKEKVKLLLEECNSGVQEVPDPYYGGDDGFEKVYKLIEGACDIIAKKINGDGQN